MKKVIIFAMILVVGCGYVVWGKLNQAEAASGIDKDEIGFNIDEQAKAKFPKLIKLVLASESLQKKEKQYWLDHMMTMPQARIDRLFKILNDEKIALDDFHRKQAIKAKAEARRTHERRDEYQVWQSTMVDMLYLAKATDCIPELTDAEVDETLDWIERHTPDAGEKQSEYMRRISEDLQKVKASLLLDKACEEPKVQAQISALTKDGLYFAYKKSIAMLKKVCQQANDSLVFVMEASGGKKATDDSMVLARQALAQGAKDITSIIQGYDYISNQADGDTKMKATYFAMENKVSIFYHSPDLSDYRCRWDNDGYAFEKAGDNY